VLRLVGQEPAAPFRRLLILSWWVGGRQEAAHVADALQQRSDRRANVMVSGTVDEALRADADVLIDYTTRSP